MMGSWWSLVDPAIIKSVCISLPLSLSILFVVQVGAQKFADFGISVGWHLALCSVVCKNN
jgi:hypothetical protein